MSHTLGKSLGQPLSVMLQTRTVITLPMRIRLGILYLTLVSGAILNVSLLVHAEKQAINANGKWPQIVQQCLNGKEKTIPNASLLAMEIHLGASIPTSILRKTIGVHVFSIARKRSLKRKNVDGFLIHPAWMSLNTGASTSLDAQQLITTLLGVLCQIPTVELGLIAITSVQATARKPTRSTRRSRKTIHCAPGSLGQSAPSPSFTKARATQDALTVIILLLGALSTLSTTEAGRFASVSAPKLCQNRRPQQQRPQQQHPR